MIEDKESKKEDIMNGTDGASTIIGADNIKLSDAIKDVLNKPKVEILNDAPTVVDLLGYKNLIRIFSEIVLSAGTQTPITMGIDGKWGSGKTSILKMIESQAKMLKLPCIWLNAWTLENSRTLFSTLVAEIKREMDNYVKTKSLSDKLHYSFKKALFSTGEIIMDSMDDASGVQKVIRLKNLTKRYDKDVSEISKMTEELASSQSLYHSFKDVVKNLLDAVKTYSDPRLIIFIDDVDRALPDQVITILKNLKLILEVPNCIFILAMDVDVVAQSIESHYSSNSTRLVLSDDTSDAKKSFGHKYLEKIIQIHIKIPNLTRDSVEAYLQDLGTEPEPIEIIKWAPDSEVLNPRRLKRYVNWLKIYRQIISSVNSRREFDDNTLLKIIAIRRDYDELFYDLINAPCLWKIDIDTLNNYHALFPESTYLLLDYVKKRISASFTGEFILKEYTFVFEDYFKLFPIATGNDKKVRQVINPFVILSMKIFQLYSIK